MNDNDKEEEFGALFLPGFEGALVGLGYQFNTPLAVYDMDECINIMVARDGMEPEEAVEFFDFNIGGAWAGPSTPVFIRRVP